MWAHVFMCPQEMGDHDKKGIIKSPSTLYKALNEMGKSLWFLLTGYSWLKGAAGI